MQKYQDYKGASEFCNKKIAFWGCLLQKHPPMGVRMLINL